MKEEIIHSSLAQFLKYGTRKVSLQSIVEPLGISTKTVYKYFKNKESLLEEALLLYYDQQFRMLRNISSDHNAVPLLFNVWYMGVQNERQVKEVFFQDIHDYYPALEAKIEAIIRKKFSRQFIQIIRVGIKDGSISENIFSEVVFESISLLYTASIRTAQFKNLQFSFYDIFLNTITIMIRGICTEKGVQLLNQHIQYVKKSGGIELFQQSMLLVEDIKINEN